MKWYSALSNVRSLVHALLFVSPLNLSSQHWFHCYITAISLLASVGIIVVYIYQDLEDSFVKGNTWYVVFFKYIG